MNAQHSRSDGNEIRRKVECAFSFIKIVKLLLPQYIYIRTIIRVYTTSESFYSFSYLYFHRASFAVILINLPV